MNPRPWYRHPRSFTLPAVLLLAGIAATGCSRDAARSIASRVTAPVPSAPVAGMAASPASQPGSYPLALGNRWVYAQVDTAWIDYDAGGTSAMESFSSVRTVELTRLASVGGRDYVVQREATVSPDTPGLIAEYLYRQDASGLYVADVIAPGSGDLARPAAPGLRFVTGPLRGRAAGAFVRLSARLAALAHGGVAPVLAAPAITAADAPPTEARLLAYPLHTHASWDVRTDVRFVDTVEGPETVALGADHVHAWRISEDTDFFGPPSDAVHLWYGAAGFLGLEARLQGVFTDDYGNRLGIAHVNEHLALLEASFAAPNAP